MAGSSTTEEVPAVSVSTRRSVTGAVIGFVVITAYLAATIFYSLPSNVVASREGELSRQIAVGLAPQAWGFFTKPPNDEEYVPYQVTDEGFEPLLAFPQSTPENAYGLARGQRAQGVEMGIVGATVTEWTTCTAGVSDDCKYAALDGPVSEAVNESQVATLCGDILIARTVPVPWHYRDYYEERRMDSATAVINVECP